MFSLFFGGRGGDLAGWVAALGAFTFIQIRWQRCRIVLLCVSSLFLFFSSMKYGGRFFPLPFDIWFMFHFHFWENLGAKASRASRWMDGEASEWDNPFG